VSDSLRVLDEAQLRIQDYEEAARMSDPCRARGIAGSAIDFLICAVAHLRNWQIFTINRDSTRYSKGLPLMLY
jgi:predicted nucleic acid-binding protein